MSAPISVPICIRELRNRAKSSRLEAERLREEATKLLAQADTHQDIAQSLESLADNWGTREEKPSNMKGTN